MSQWSRRAFLRMGGLTALSWACPSGLLASSRYKTRRVVLVAFAGGVRSRETIETPRNVPNLMRIAEQGIVCPEMQAENVGHYGATLSILTGRTEVLGIRQNERGDHPTLFEYLRKQEELEARQVWLSSSGGVQGLNFAYGNHPDYGPRYGANLISGEGIFNAELGRMIERFGKPKPESKADAAALDQLAGSLRSFEAGGAVANDRVTAQRLERYILDELSGETARLTGPGAEDAKTLQVATKMLALFRPPVLGIRLINADVAHGSYNNYVEVIRRNDAELGKLFDVIASDPEMRETTTLMILPEFGRNRDLNQRNGLDHGDGSEELHRVSLVAWGPDFRRGATLREMHRTIDVCPTVCELFGAKAPLAKGRVMRRLFV